MAVHQITYGNFTFDVAVMRVNEKILFADDGIAQIGVEYTFSISGWITGSTEADFAQKFNLAKCSLQNPRQDFLVQWAQTVAGPWAVLYHFTDKDDNDWGPKPGSLNIMRLSGGRAALFGWSLVVVSKTCYDSSCQVTSSSVGILAINRRWNFVVDANGFTTRTVSGTLVVTSQSVQQNRPADYFRDRVDPGTPITYKRQPSTFNQSENGRVLTFSIVDQEVLWTLPIGISNGHASYSIEVAPYGATCQYVLSGRFEAPASVSKTQIIKRILELAAQRLPFGVAGVDLYPGGNTIKEDIYANAIDFSITAHSACSSGQPQPNPFNLDSGIPYGQAPPGGDSGMAQPIGVYGGTGGSDNSGVAADSPEVSDGCDAGSQRNSPTPTPSSSRNTDGGSSDNSENPNQTIYVTNSGLSTEHSRNPYVAYHEEFSYEYDPGIVILRPKVTGKPPIPQQARTPLMTLIQAGYSKQVAASVSQIEQPVPAVGATGVIIHKSDPKSNGEPITGSNLYLYTTRWAYTIVFVKEITNASSTSLISYPNDPRVASANGGPLPGSSQADS